MGDSRTPESSGWDFGSHEQFYEHYARGSQSPATLQRIRSHRDCVLRVAKTTGSKGGRLEVADIGCGAGTQSFLWAELGHNVHALDVNQPLLELARRRAEEQGRQIDFQLGSATQLPWANESMDVCLLLELLEHVADWERCLSECARVLRQGGILLLTTTNNLCPIQQEFKLPLYSWYPRPLKKYFERLAVTTWPAVANYAKYPAVNWFSFYDLTNTLAPYGFECLDRFDIMDLSSKGVVGQWIVGRIQNFSVLRWLAHVATPGTTVLAVKGPEQNLLI
jgi:2-polyprenyl-6-hydroxyphenyl methylase/3-demethylubiquinone-9 3-methyltransferase